MDSTQLDPLLLVGDIERKVKKRLLKSQTTRATIAQITTAIGKAITKAIAIQMEREETGPKSGNVGA